MHICIHPPLKGNPAWGAVRRNHCVLKAVTEKAFTAAMLMVSMRISVKTPSGTILYA